jgi:hypothetical protein
MPHIATLETGRHGSNYYALWWTHQHEHGRAKVCALLDALEGLHD